LRDAAWLLAPEWSEHLNDRCVRQTWSCHACGYGFEAAVFFPAAQKAAA
jgi:hypothetical protein